MSTNLIRAAALLAVLAAATPARAAKQEEIDRAIKAGAEALKVQFATGTGGGDTTIGPACLAGLAMLEAGVPPTDKAVKAITDRVREESYAQTATYGIALCVMFLDRLGDPNDVVRIQMLAVRLLVAQTAGGGWGYTCCTVSADDVKWLKAIAGAPPAGKLHPDVERYAQSLAAARGQNAGAGDDNSNTQFAVMAVWMSRKHGVPADPALELIEKRFASTQELRTGNWPYAPGQPASSPSMYCAGLLGMATAVARREEKRKGDTVKPPPAKKDKVDPVKLNDPFYNPPPPAAAPKKDKDEPTKATDVRDATVQRGFAGLGATIADQIRSGKGLFIQGQSIHGNGDLYFLWSLERVGVVYGADKIGGFDWYDIGSTALVRTQGNDGAWAAGGYTPEINTAFAVLFLCRSNLAKDLSSRVQRDPTSTEMRAGAAAPTDATGVRPTPVAAPVLDLPNPTGDKSVALASKLLKAPDADWSKLLAAARDDRGEINTRALVVLAKNIEGARRTEVREALAERLCRMTPDTLRAMLKASEPELRRAAALACAMKDDKGHIPDLVAAMGDGEGTVVRAARAGLKSLTGKDFATADDARDWLAKDKK